MTAERSGDAEMVEIAAAAIVAGKNGGGELAAAADHGAEARITV
jgi:hypothetical protein